MDETELSIAIKYNKEGILTGPTKCKCGWIIFYIQKDKASKTSGVCFRCFNYVYRLKYPININSIFEKFTFFELQDIIEIIYKFLCLEKNAQKAHNYLKENKNIIISKIKNICRIKRYNL